MKKIIILSIGLLFFCAALAFAETSLKAEVDKLKITTDGILTYKVALTSNEQLIPGLKFPEFKGFNLVSQGQSQSVSLEKGGISSSLIYTFILSPEAPGKIKIDAASVKIKDKILTSDVFEIEVLPGKNKPQAAPPVKPVLPEGLNGPQEPQFTL